MYAKPPIAAITYQINRTQLKTKLASKHYMTICSIQIKVHQPIFKTKTKSIKNVNLQDLNYQY